MKVFLITLKNSVLISFENFVQHLIYSSLPTLWLLCRPLSRGIGRWIGMYLSVRSFTSLMEVAHIPVTLKHRLNKSNCSWWGGLIKLIDLLLKRFDNDRKQAHDYYFIFAKLFWYPIIKESSAAGVRCRLIRAWSTEKGFFFLKRNLFREVENSLLVLRGELYI